MLVFVKQFLKDRTHTGAVMPSSPHLARVMTRSVRQKVGPKRILEVGPGTGPFTRAVLAALKPGDEFHIVEINNDFAQRLEARILHPFRKANADIHVKLHHESIERADLDGRFDFIVCGLPFNNFPPDLVRSIFRRLMDLLADGGELAYFEYAGVRVMKGPLVGPKGRQKLKQIRMTGKVLRRRHDGRCEIVLANVPPAMAYRLKRATV